MLVAMNDASRLTRDDFPKLTSIAKAEAIPPPERIWPDADWRVIERGHKSSDMDDKWNVFVEGHRLHLHRSWTGRGIYEAEFAQVPGGWQVITAVVEGDRGSYRRHQGRVRDCASRSTNRREATRRLQRTGSSTA